MHIPRQADAVPPPWPVGDAASGVVPNTPPTATPQQPESDMSKSTNGVAIALPIVVGVGIILALTYFVSIPVPPSGISRHASCDRIKLTAVLQAPAAGPVCTPAAATDHSAGEDNSPVVRGRARAAERHPRTTSPGGVTPHRERAQRRDATRV